MRPAKALMLIICLFALVLPLAHGIFFIGPTNFIATNGGITTFAQNFQARSLTYANGLNHFTSLVWGGNQRGNFGIDADTGVNVTVTQVGRDQVTYTVTTLAPAPVDTYIYYRRNVAMSPLSSPSLVTADGVAAPYTYAGGVATVTTTGSPVTVVVHYMGGGTVHGQMIDTIGLLIGLITLLVLSMIVYAAGQGDMSLDAAWKTTLLVLVLAAMAYLFRGWGY